MNIKTTVRNNPVSNFRPSVASSPEEKPKVISDTELRAQQKREDLYSGLAFVASGTVAGALGGALGNNTLGRTVATTVTTTVADTATLMAVDKLTNPFIHFGHVVGPMVGAGTGIAGGLLGAAITSVTGMSPVASGAVAGAFTHGALLVGMSAMNR